MANEVNINDTEQDYQVRRVKESIKPIHDF